jgi:hypothetical protein
MARADSPLRGAGPDLDTYEPRHGLVGQKRGCSYCGSLPPDDFMDAVRAGKEIEPTDKGYKFYVNEPLTDEQKAQDRQSWIGHYLSLGLSEAAAAEAADTNPTAPSGDIIGKFYTPHLSPEQGDEFIELWKAKKINWGYPGGPYVRLFIPGHPRAV